MDRGCSRASPEAPSQGGCGRGVDGSLYNTSLYGLLKGQGTAVCPLILSSPPWGCRLFPFSWKGDTSSFQGCVGHVGKMSRHPLADPALTSDADVHGLRFLWTWCRSFLSVVLLSCRRELLEPMPCGGCADGCLRKPFLQPVTHGSPL